MASGSSLQPIWNCIFNRRCNSSRNEVLMRITDGIQVPKWHAIAEDENDWISPVDMNMNACGCCRAAMQHFSGGSFRLTTKILVKHKLHAWYQRQHAVYHQAFQGTIMKVFLLTALFAGASAQNFNNPVLYQDLADLDIVRHNDTFYYSASTMHFSPGAPILRSYDLVNWEYFYHSVPVLDFGMPASYNLNTGSAYNKGIFASFFNHNQKLKTWFWGGCTVGDGKTHIYTATDPGGPWARKSTLNLCYYDSGLFVDDDGIMYVVHLSAWSQTQITLAQLTADGLGEVKRQVVWNTPSSLGYVEGLKMYRRDGFYYLLGVHPQDGNIILKSRSPWGPYEWKWLVLNAGQLLPGFTAPKQGSLVSLADGRWYHMAFIDGYPGGRIPALAPIDWSSDGWPTARLVNGTWAKQYPYPLKPRAVKSLVGTDTFTAVGPQYEWNHNPDPAAWSIKSGGLELRTCSITDDFFLARNTLSHRILGPSSAVTVHIDYSQMADGDRAGLVLFDYNAGWIGVVRSGNTFRVVMWNGIAMSNTNGWKPSNKGAEVAGATISGGTIWLRTKANILPREQPGTFQYSTDGVNFVNLGNTVTLINDKVFFMGWRYGIFNFATKALGGRVTIRSFAIDGTMLNHAPGESGTSTVVTVGTSATPTTTGLTISTASTTSSAPTPCQTLYGQCGGQGWNGPQCCSQGTCKLSNEWDDDVEDLFDDFQRSHHNRAEQTVSGSQSLYINLQTLTASENPFLRNFAIKYVLPWIQDEIIMAKAADVVAEAPRVEELPTPFRAKAIAFDDELPAAPFSHEFAAPYRLFPTIGASLALFWLVVNIQFPFDLPFSWGGGSEPLNRKWLPGKDLKDSLLVVVSVCSHPILGEKAGPQLHLMCLLAQMLAPNLVYTVEAYRRGNLQTILASPFLNFAIMGIAALAGAQQYWTIAFALFGHTLPTGRQMPMEVARSLLPALVFGFTIPAILVFVPIPETKLRQDWNALWQFGTFIFISLTYISSRMLRYYEQFDSRQIILMKSHKHEGKDDALVVQYHNRDTALLKEAHTCVWAGCAIKHVLTLLYAHYYPDISLYGFFLVFPRPFQDWSPLGRHTWIASVFNMT
ncbi:putative beta-xylosidase [Paramyrothecium foliicola]|nr:putative beta-xylosidase [Paramyrothecium foliicola]